MTKDERSDLRMESIIQRGASLSVFPIKYSWDHQIKEDDIGGVCSTNGEKIKVYMVLVGKPRGKRQLEVAGLERDNIKMVLKILR